jgi:menaquinone-dependent protoporphyrinogen oxidase
MKLLIAYATTEGQTGKICKFIGEKISEAGHHVDYLDVKDLSGDLSVTDFDKVIIAGSVHAGKHQEELELFVFANRDRLIEIQCLFVSVSLAVVFPDSREDAEEYVKAFQENASWNPAAYLLVAGAMRHGAYGWFEETTLLAGDLAGHAAEELKEDQEFTDWNGLQRSVLEFIEN